LPLALAVFARFVPHFLVAARVLAGPESSAARTPRARALREPAAARGRGESAEAAANVTLELLLAALSSSALAALGVAVGAVLLPLLRLVLRDTRLGDKDKVLLCEPLVVPGQ